MATAAHLWGVAMETGRLLTTSRLIMAPHGKADFADLAAMWADPAVVRLLCMAGLSEVDATDLARKPPIPTRARVGT